MKSFTYVDNIKCQGCSTRIINKLNRIENIANVTIVISEGKVSFDCIDDRCREKVIEALKTLGHPQSGKGSTLDKVKSYASCMIGRFEK